MDQSLKQKKQRRQKCEINSEVMNEVAICRGGGVESYKISSRIVGSTYGTLAFVVSISSLVTPLTCSGGVVTATIKREPDPSFAV